MISAIFFLSIVCYFIFIRLRLSAGGWLGLLWLFSIWSFTYVSHQYSGFVSPDEVYFATADLNILTANRSLWLLINGATGAFTDNIIGQMRILNLGFLTLLYVTAVLTFRTIPPLLIAFCLSYAACVAALNLRDVAILFGTIYLLSYLGKVGPSIKDMVKLLISHKWIALFLFLLRPQMALILFSSVLRLRVLAIFIAGILLFLQTNMGSRYFYNYSYYTQNFDTAIAERAEAKEYQRTEPNLINIGYWSARFVFAPDPISSLNRLLTQPETHPYGTIDLAFRTLSRFILYGLLIAIFYQVARSPKAALNVIRDHAFALKFGMLFSLLYALFNFGSSHERVKMVILVLVLYIVDRLWAEIPKRRQIGNADLSHSHKLA